jgi:hypothetical protein
MSAGRPDSRRGEWTAVYRRRMASVNSDPRLSDFAVRILNWLTYEVDPACGCLPHVTIRDLAGIFAKKPDTVRGALGELEHHGYVTFEFPGRGKPGWVQVTGYYGEVMHPNRRLADRWEKGAPKRRRLRQPALKVVR